MKGFTLIELLITLMIVSIITVLAYPTAISLLMTSRRSDAWISLTKMQMVLEQCYAQNFSYELNCNLLPHFPSISLNGYYSIDLTEMDKNHYLLTAIPVGSQIKDTGCARLTINQANVRMTLDSLGLPSSCK